MKTFNRLLAAVCATAFMATAMLPSAPAFAAPDATASLRPAATLPRPMAMPDGSTMKKIQDRGRLIVGVSQDKYAIGFLNPLTNELEGFDVEMAKAMAKAIFGNENKLQIIAVASADRIPLIKAGKVDMVISTFTINAKRKEEINFSEVYYMSGQKILVHKDSPAKSIADLSGQRVCAPAGSTSAKGIVTANPAAKLVETVEFTDCLAMFMMRQVDAISTDDVILAGLAKQDPFAKVVGPSFSAEPYGIGMSKDQPDLVRFVNGVLVQMKSDGSWKRIYDKWFGAMGATEPPRGTYLD
ncbi:glutamate ABC transporter substrate-binding protein [soil metagenome]